MFLDSMIDAIITLSANYEKGKHSLLSMKLPGCSGVKCLHIFRPKTLSGFVEGACFIELLRGHFILIKYIFVVSVSQPLKMIL